MFPPHNIGPATPRVDPELELIKRELRQLRRRPRHRTKIIYWDVATAPGGAGRIGKTDSGGVSARNDVNDTMGGGNAYFATIDPNDGGWTLDLTTTPVWNIATRRVAGDTWIQVKKELTSGLWIVDMEDCGDVDFVQMEDEP